MQQLMYSFVGLEAPAAILDGVRRGEITSFCLFAGMNLTTPAQVRTLTGQLLRAAREGGQPPPLLGTDQEGGQLMAISDGVTELPGNMALGATRSPELAHAAGRLIARELLAMGINLNFAPSLDVNINPANPVIGIRSFGDDPELVAALGAALIGGIQTEGVLATAKHFPGHGDTASDTHDGDAIIAHSMARMNAVELVPFRRAIAAGVAAVMPGHLTFTALDAAQPTTLSAAVMTGLLRRELGFDGLVITDAMDMHAVARRGRIESLSAALKAGADLVLLAHLDDQLALSAPLARWANPASVARISAARQRVPVALPPFEVIGSAEHRAIARTIAEAAITRVRDDGRLPLRPGADAEIAVITTEPANLTPADTSAQVTIRLADAVRAYHPRTRAWTLALDADDSTIDALADAVASAETIIVGTINAVPDDAQARLIRRLLAHGRQPVVAALRTPYDIAAFNDVTTYLCAYSIREVSMQALARVLFGEIEARGVLPCAIPGVSGSAYALG